MLNFVTSDNGQLIPGIGPLIETIGDQNDFLSAKTGVQLGHLTNVNVDAFAPLQWTVPKDRTWDLTKAMLFGLQVDNGGFAAFNALQVDGNPLIAGIEGVGGGFYHCNGAGVTATAYPHDGSFSQAPPSANTRYPIRNTISVVVHCHNPINAPNSFMLAVWIWETEKFTPAKIEVTTTPAQTVDESWQ